MTAEEYFDKNHIASKSHLSDNGLVYEEREVYKIMEAYHQAKLKEVENPKAHLFCDNFEIDNINSSSTKCKNCWGEKWQHNQVNPSL